MRMNGPKRARARRHARRDVRRMWANLRAATGIVEQRSFERWYKPITFEDAPPGRPIVALAPRPPRGARLYDPDEGPDLDDTPAIFVRGGLDR